MRPAPLSRATLLLLLLVASLFDGAGAKGSGGSGGGRSTGRATYGSGRTLTRGYTRTYFFVFAAGGSSTRHRCGSCSRTTAENDMAATMQALVVVAEFDVSFPAGTALGSEAAPATIRGLAEPYVEGRVAAMVSRAVPSVTQEDVSVRDSWKAAATCTGTASNGDACDLDGATDGTAACPIGCVFDNTTVMYEVSVFAGEAVPGDVLASGAISPTSQGARVLNALRLCGDCGHLGAASATANGGATCAADGLAAVAETRLASCCNATVLEHVTAFGANLATSGLIANTTITDCGNRTIEVMTLGSEVEQFGSDGSSSSGGLMVILVLFCIAVFCCVCKKVNEKEELADRRKRSQALIRDLQQREQARDAWMTNRPDLHQGLAGQQPVIVAQIVQGPPPTATQAHAKGEAMMALQLPVARAVAQPSGVILNPVLPQGRQGP